MRNPFRKIYNSRRRRTLVYFLTPSGVALMLLTLLAQNPQLLAAPWNDPAKLRGDSASALDSADRDPHDVLAERSPGARDPNALYSIKPEHVVALKDLPKLLPHERVLSAVRERPAPGLPPALPTDAAAPVFSTEPLAFDAPDLGMPDLPAVTNARTAPGLFGGAPAPGISSLAVPPGSPLPIVSTELLPPVDATDLPPSSPPTDEAQVPSAVPEPSTWLMNIVGFFAIAGVLRRRGRTVRSPERSRGTVSAITLKTLLHAAG